MEKCINENLGLSKDEKIIEEITPSPLGFIVYYLFGGFLCFLFGIGIILILIVELNRRKTKYYITNKRVIHEYTFLSNNVSSVNYSKIQDLHLEQGFIEREFKIGNIKINTAGSNKIELELKSIKNPIKVKNIIEKHLSKEKIEKIEKKEDAIDKIERLHSLMEKGIITKSEFENKKKILLE